MTGYQELLDALRQASAAVSDTGDPAAAGRMAAQEAAMGRLQACLKGGLPPLNGKQAEAVAARLRTLLVSNSLNLKWTSLRARLARIGVLRRARKSPGVPRLDLVS